MIDKYNIFGKVIHHQATPWLTLVMLLAGFDKLAGHSVCNELHAMAPAQPIKKIYETAERLQSEIFAQQKTHPANEPLVDHPILPFTRHNLTKSKPPVSINSIQSLKHIKPAPVYRVDVTKISAKPILQPPAQATPPL